MTSLANGTVDQKQVQHAEQERIKHQRRVRRQPDSDKSIGITISGGGIRSASFAMGILQALAGKGFLQRFDYLSTVSGGGYIGSSLSWFNKLFREGALDADPDKYFFPFGLPDEGARSGVSMPNKILSFIRQHSNYLVPGGGLNYISGFAVVFRNMVLPLVVYIALMVSLFSVLIVAEQSATVDGLKEQLKHLMKPEPNLALLLALFSSLLFTAVGVIYGAVTFLLSATSEFAYRARTFVQRLIGYLVTAALIFLVLGIIPLMIVKLEHALATVPGGIVGIAGGIYHFVQRERSSKVSLPTNVVATVSALLLILFILATSYFLAMNNPGWITVFATAVGGLLLGWFVNINQFGIGRMYRDRLMETFMPDVAAVRDGRWKPATQAATAALSTYCSEEDQGPYHILNTNLILVDSDNRKFQGRGGDNFILSPLYCGSDATRWQQTEDFDSRHLTLATAMATSGAAVNPHAGPNSTGISKNPLISFLMFLLGLRMGIYALNPSHNKFSGLYIPNYIVPGIFQGLLAKTFDATSRYLSLSDGGHFENTATYELIRRRLDVIVISEAGQDADYSFADIANLVEKVRVDFGTKIRFRESHDLRDLVPGSLESTAAGSYACNLARRGYAIADIEYPKLAGEESDPPAGILFMVKATMTDGLPADLYSYQTANPEFPNQTTLDQFFSEVQVESYRELGYQLAKAMATESTFVAAMEPDPKEPSSTVD
jgi:hypothetical protein